MLSSYKTHKPTHTYSLHPHKSKIEILLTLTHTGWEREGEWSKLTYMQFETLFLSNQPIEIKIQFLLFFFNQFSAHEVISCGMFNLTFQFLQCLRFCGVHYVLYSSAKAECDKREDYQDSVNHHNCVHWTNESPHIVE